LIYVEYIGRRPEVDLATFHLAVATGQEGWDTDYAEDQLIWSAARTWRLGPAPQYLGVWYTPGGSLGRIDDWDRIFRSGHADVHENVFRRAALIESAGCYTPLREPIHARGGIYYAEYFRPGSNSAAIQDFFEERARRHVDFTLNLLIQRIGRLGPEPGGLAVWTIPRFAALATIASELEGVREPIELVAAGTYVDVGREIL
jgi:hypothetical protein